jgi:hypothetical protein
MYHLGMPSVLSNFFLSCKNQNQAQTNTVVSAQKIMNWWDLNPRPKLTSLANLLSKGTA